MSPTMTTPPIKNNTAVAEVTSLSKDLSNLVVSSEADLKDKVLDVFSDHDDTSNNTNDSILDDPEPNSFISDSLTAADPDCKSDVKGTTPYHPNQERPSRPSSCVFVASLNASLTDDQLNHSVSRHFSQWGTICFVKVLRDLCERPYAFVQFNTDEEAKNATAKGQGSYLDSRHIRCEPARVNRTLFIYHTPSTSTSQLNGYLEAFGEVEELVDTRVKSRSSNTDRGWFARFAYRSDAIKAFLHIRTQGDFEVEWTQNLNHEARKTVTTVDPKSIFIGQLNPATTSEDLRSVFGKHGKILACQIQFKEREYPSHTGPTKTLARRPSAFAFISFDSAASADAAVEKENHSILRNHTIHVQYREVQHQKTISNSLPVLEFAPPPVNIPAMNRQRRHHSLPSYNTGYAHGEPREFVTMENDPSQDVELDHGDKPTKSNEAKPKINIGTPFQPKRASSYGGLQNSRWGPQGQYRMERENQYPQYHGSHGNYGSHGSHDSYVTHVPHGHRVYRGGYGRGGGRRPSYRHKGGYCPPQMPYYVNYQDWYAPQHMGGYYMDQPPQRSCHSQVDKAKE